MAVETTPGNLPLASLKQELIGSLPASEEWVNSDTCVTGNLMFLEIVGPLAGGGIVNIYSRTLNLAVLPGWGGLTHNGGLLPLEGESLMDSARRFSLIIYGDPDALFNIGNSFDARVVYSVSSSLGTSDQLVTVFSDAIIPTPPEAPE